MSSENRAGELHARQLLRRINIDAGNGAAAAEIIVMEDETDSTEQAAGFLAPIVVEASSAGLPRVNISSLLVHNRLKSKKTRTIRFSSLVATIGVG